MRIFLNDKFIFILIILNSLLLFIDAFEASTYVEYFSYNFIHSLDIGISILFLVEMFVKIHTLKSFKKYISDNWNKLDFAINLLIFPSVVFWLMNQSTDIWMLSVLRLVRVAKFLRFFKFIPNIERLLAGIKRALKSSIFIIFSLLLYLFITSIISCFLFKNILPQNFGDPILSFYSTFKVFTIEGWYDLPEKIAELSSPEFAFFAKIYFIFLVLSGGICGLSLINAVFVDEMLADNNDEVLVKIEELSRKIDALAKNSEKTSEKD